MVEKVKSLELTDKARWLHEDEGALVPATAGPVIDAHVHVFPDKLFEAVWGWFDRFGWPIRYRLHAGELLDFLLGRGVAKIVALQYAHRPGIARSLNESMVALCEERKEHLAGMAAVFPGEPGATEILNQALDQGLAGVKLHPHVLGIDLLAEEMEAIYALCEKRARPLVMHAGQEPASDAYPRDTYAITGCQKVKEVLLRHPGLKLLVPHLGAGEFCQFRDLCFEVENLWLDTAMAVAGYLPASPPALSSYRIDRLLYGSDFPNLPYAWDRELKRLSNTLDAEASKKVFYGNAVELFFG